jgi:prephenate dehydrogenase
MASTPNLANNIYSDPPTFMGVLVECAQFIEKSRHDPTSSKEDVLDSMENRLSLLVGKMASHPLCGTFRVELEPGP